jgi:hypothetical protein
MRSLNDKVANDLNGAKPEGQTSATIMIVAKLGRSSVMSFGVMIRTTRGLHIPSSELHAIASEIAPADFRMLPSIRFDPSN